MITFVALAAIFVVVLVPAVAIAKIVDLVRERDELEVDNRSMRQRLTVARTLIDPFLGPKCGPGGQLDEWMQLTREWSREEDADPHVVAMRERVAKLQAQRELDAIRS